MTDDIAFPELENDAQAIAAFLKREVHRTEDALCDARFDADVTKIAEIMEDPDNIGGVVRRGNWIYNWHRDADHPRGLWRRVPDGTELSADADWQTVFDLDAFCEQDGEDWHWRGAVTLWSDPDRVIMYLSYQGSDQVRLLEWDCGTGKPVSDGFDLPSAKYTLAWPDKDTLLLGDPERPGAATRAGRPREVVEIKRGDADKIAPIVFVVGEDDIAAGAYTYPLSNGGRGVGWLRARTIGDFVVQLEKNGQRITLEAPRGTMPSHNDRYYAYLAADDGSDPAGTLVLREVGGTDRRILFEPGPRRSVQSDSVQFSRDYLFWIEVDTLTPNLRRLDLTDPKAEPVTLQLPIEVQAISISSHDSVGTGIGPIQLRTAGFLTPAQTWLFDPDTDAEKPVFTLLLTNTQSFDSTGMEVRLHMATSDDGTEVPYHLVLPKDHETEMGNLPVLQYGYGGFNISKTPTYLRLRGPVWLTRGGAYVQAYIRGGGEFGKAWHLAGKAEHRPRAFEDFAAVAADLVKRGYSRPERIACNGGSNGGLLCGVMLTRYPERFGAVWASVGVHDMLRFHLFTAGPAWIDEYGDPDDPEARKWLQDYSPMHNVVPHADRPYPFALIDTNDSDDRVDPSHSRRFAAALREAGQPTYFHSRTGGHGGGGRTTAIAREQALGYAFLRMSLSL